VKNPMHFAPAGGDPGALQLISPVKSARVRGSLTEANASSAEHGDNQGASSAGGSEAVAKPWEAQADAGRARF